MLDIFDRYKRSTKNISKVFRTYADLVERLGSPKQHGFFAQDPPSQIELLKAADDIVKEGIKPSEQEEDAPPLLAGKT